MDKETKKGVVIVLIILITVLILWGLDGWRRQKNKFVYEKHLDDVVITVDEKQVTLRELGYYVYDVESKIDKQARIYNPEDPLDYWNTYFNSGYEGGYISEMAEEAILGSCVCDLIYEQMALQNGCELTTEEKETAASRAEVFFSSMTEAQKAVTGLTPEIVAEVTERKALVLKFATEYFEDVDFTGYSGYREELVSYAGDYYREEILPLHEVSYEYDIVREWKIGRVTTDYLTRY